MSLRTLFAEIFGPAWNEAETVMGELELTAESIVHQAEKEIAMSLPQTFSDTLARIEALFSSRGDQSSTLQSQLNDAQAANAAKDTQIAQLTSNGQAKDAQITDLTQKLSDATAQIGEMEQALLDSANKLGA